jgi:diguanylate cyclase (GGDEF)-like protein
MRPHRGTSTYGRRAGASLPTEAALLVGLFDRLPLVLGINLAVALVSAVVFWPVIAAPVIDGWTVVMALTVAARLLLWRAYRAARPEAEAMPLWARRYSLAAAATGAAWGAAGVVLYVPEPVIYQVFLPFVLAGMVAGSVMALAAHLPAFFAFYLLALLPYGGRLALADDLPHRAMTALVALFMVMLGVLGREVHRSLREATRLALENRSLEAALGEQRSAFEGLNQGVAVFDRELRLTSWNQRFEKLHGFPPALRHVGTPVEDLLRHDVARQAYGPGDPERQLADKLAALRRGEPLWFEKRGADDRVLEVRCTPLSAGGFVCTAMDVTERKRAEAWILHMAQHDGLTGLPNRLLFHDRLSQHLTRAKRAGEPLAVMLLDLDRFKAVNDVFGHAGGDHLLHAVAGRLRGALRDSDTVARLGGDEFGLILPALDGAAAVTVAGKLLDAVRRPVALDGGEMAPGASIGIALYPFDGAEPARLLRNADLALYRAKAAGGDNYRFYDAAIRLEADARQRLERDLRGAMEKGGLEVVYQPQLDLARGTVVGVEARLRWTHPELGLVAAAELAQVAEAGGLTAALGAWTLRRACAQARAWRDEGPRPLRVAVDVSAAQLQRGDLPAAVARVLEETGLQPGLLELEVAASDGLARLDAAPETLRRLRAAGVSLALDGFGSGAGCLDLLRRLAFDALKVDLGLVREPPDAREAGIMARAVVDFGHDLGLRVVAQGIDGRDQLAILRVAGCDEAQGDAVGRAVPAAELAASLLRERPGGAGRVAPG